MNHITSLVISSLIGIMSGCSTTVRVKGQRDEIMNACIQGVKIEYHWPNDNSPRYELTQSVGQQRGEVVAKFWRGGERAYRTQVWITFDKPNADETYKLSLQVEYLGGWLQRDQRDEEAETKVLKRILEDLPMYQAGNQDKPDQ